MPPGQGLQAPDPACAKVPGVQNVAGGVGVTDPAGHPYPGLQAPVQVGEDRPLLLPKRPAGHAVQDDAPARLYCPTAHVPLQPVMALTAAVVTPKVPGAHWVQASLPYRVL